MFNFFRKKEQPKEEQIKFRAENALMDNPSLSSISLSISIKLYSSFLARILPIVDFPTPIIPVKVRFFPKLASFLILIFHKYVLFIEFKSILNVCNLNTTEAQA